MVASDGIHHSLRADLPDVYAGAGSRLCKIRLGICLGGESRPSQAWGGVDRLFSGQIGQRFFDEGSEGL